MKRVRSAAPQLDGMEPYDPKYLPASVLLSANENPHDVPAAVREAALAAVKNVAFHRYPDPLANELRDLIAEANGITRDQVLVGNGGDELLFDLALAWGGPGRTLLTVPPTFSVYAANARLTGTDVVSLARRDDFSVDEETVLDRVSRGDIDYVVITSPNNPTGCCVSEAFVERLLDATDALVVIDEAYCEFSRRTVAPLLAEHDNLCVLRTFSKAYSLAGVRIGYLLASETIVRELLKVRQPYSVDAVSQAIATAVFSGRAAFEPGIEAIIAERARVLAALEELPEVTVWPSEANFILLRVADAGAVWQTLYDAGVLVRDFSRAEGLKDCLRVSIGSREESDAFLREFRKAVAAR